MQQNNFLKVEGNISLIRDVSTHAIINTNIAEYEKYCKKNYETNKQANDIERNTNDINTIKQDLTEIKSLILLLLQK